MKLNKIFLFLVFLLPIYLNVLGQDSLIKKISKLQAIEDLKQFERILKVESSYFGMYPFDLDLRLEQLKSKWKDSVEVPQLGVALEKIMGEVGDRHSSISNFKIKLDKFLPFVVAPIGKKLVALNEKKDNRHSIFIEKYPYLKAIDGVPIGDFIEEISFRNKYAPIDAKWAYAANDIISIGLLYYKLGKTVPNPIKITFTDGKKDIDKEITLSKTKPKPWHDIQDRNDLILAIEKGKAGNDTLFQILDNNIGYFRIPVMWNFNQNPSLFPLIKSKMNEFRNTKALILDVRNNGGGERDILMTLAPYFVEPGAKPWVANLAKIRIDQTLNEDISSMRFRYLYNINSPDLDERKRQAITDFMKDYHPNWNYDSTRYSNFFYMVLDQVKNDTVFYYDKPVYVLADEGSFSATSVFVSALKGMNKIKIVGVNTDGSSGRSERVSLKNSGITVRYSTMISFQRNGKTLDTNGTAPDIFSERDLNQILGIKDSQLEALINLIDNRKK